MLQFEELFDTGAVFTNRMNRGVNRRVCCHPGQSSISSYESSDWEAEMKFEDMQHYGRIETGSSELESGGRGAAHKAQVLGHKVIGARSLGAQAIGAFAVGALSVGAIALGALAIGRLGVARMIVGRSRVRFLEIEELSVNRLRVGELIAKEKLVMPTSRCDVPAAGLRTREGLEVPRD